MNCITRFINIYQMASNMIVEREKFIEDFVKWVVQKLNKELPEEGFESEMLEKSIRFLIEHGKCYE